MYRRCTYTNIHTQFYTYALIFYVPPSDRIWSSSENQFKHEPKRQLNDVVRL